MEKDTREGFAQYHAEQFDPHFKQRQREIEKWHMRIFKFTHVFIMTAEVMIIMLFGIIIFKLIT